MDRLASDCGEPVIRRRLGEALLALVSAYGSRGVDRAAARALLWPDENRERARNSMKELLHAIRGCLGVDPFYPDPQSLVLDPRVVEVDHWEFEKAISRCDLVAATSCYAGPFVNGLAVPSRPQLSRTLEEKRSELATQYRKARVSLARIAHACGNHQAAVVQWRAILDADSFDDEAATGVILALLAAGARVEALRFSHAYRQRLSRQLGAQPSARFERSHAEALQAPLPPDHLARVVRPRSVSGIAEGR